MGDQNQRMALAKHPSVFTLKQNFSTWFKQFRNFCDLCQVPDNTRFRTLLSFLDQECFILVENLNLTEAQRANIQDNAVYVLIKNALKSTDSRVPPGYELKYRKQKDSESIEQYAAALESLAMDAYPNEQDIRANRNLIECFISGVKNDELAIKLLQNQFDNFTQVINMAKQYFQALQTRRFIKTESEFRPTLEKVYNVSDENDEVNVLSKSDQHSKQAEAAINTNIDQRPRYNQNFQFQGRPQAENMQQRSTPWSGRNNNWSQNQMGNPQDTPWTTPTYTTPYNDTGNMQRFESNGYGQYNYMNNASPSPNNSGLYNQNRRSRQNVICFFCQKPGHYKTECFSYLRMIREQNHQNQQQVDTCSYCGKRGHKAANCWALLGKNDTRNPNQGSLKNPFRPT